MTPELTVLISFLGFVWIFWKKIYPLLAKKLDEHIETVKKKIADAEALKDAAYASLQQAHLKKSETEALIEANKLKTEKKIRLMYEENEKLMRSIMERYETSMKAQLEAEIAKQKNQLIEKLSDLLIEKLMEKVNDSNCKLDTNVDKKDLEKLFSSREFSNKN
ncbi:MAG: hypothetical protein LBB29_02470 [Holosporaceae bacterium]|jgi:F0F1-type ATP synthase membrane subunit b/b'|nr:hypothetical protein [Holosporaceae bacterium]